MAPVFGRLAKHYRKRIEFIAVNATDRPDIAKRFGIRRTPTFVLLRNGKPIRHFYGNIPESVLKQYLDPFAPDVDEQPGGDEDEPRGLLARLFRRRN
jgi:thioredoxin-like negative regulator of GroEL